VAIDYGSVTTGVRLRGRVLGEDHLQRGLRGDRVVLAYGAAHPRAATWQAAVAVKTPKRLAARNLDRHGIWLAGGRLG
jgi:hypothetical protein